MGLVALPVFKTGGPAKSGPVGSIPTRLRQPFAPDWSSRGFSAAVRGLHHRPGVPADNQARFCGGVAAGSWRPMVAAIPRME